jgi:hypothetical protein
VAVLAAYNAANARIDVTDLLPRVQVPTLVIHEAPFPFGSYELCREVAAGIPGARFVIVTENSLAGRGHDANVTAINGFPKNPFRPASVTRPLSEPLVDWAQTTDGSENEGQARVNAERWPKSALASDRIAIGTIEDGLCMSPPSVPSSL